MADDKLPAAIREAEEWLTRYDGAVSAIPPGSADPPEVRLLRSLLAALTAEGEAKATVGRAVYAPGGEGKACHGCGGLGWIPAGDEQLGCIDCNGTGRCDEREAHYELGLRMAITDSDDLRWRRWAQKLLDDAHRVPELESLLRECNAVCLCGCPESEHESYGEDGESCGDEKHECIRVAPAVLDYVNRLRSRPLPPGVEAAAEALRYELDEVVRDLTYATLNTRHVRTVLSYLSSARGAKGGGR